MEISWHGWLRLKPFDGKPSDLRKLRSSLIVLALAVALGVAAFVASRDRLLAARASFRAAQGERDAIGGKLGQVRGEENEIRRKAALFGQLRARGALGDERRLEWVELLQEIRDRHRLIEMRYEFAPRRAIDRDGARAEKLGLYASAMKLQARLLHEEDLTRLLGDLRRQAPALIQVRRCDLARLPGAGDALREGTLRADCLIDWITLRETGPGGGAPK
ncbi:MAG: hypothetical protein LBI87_13220 [Candidatus Accumulibacter sp.]|nr:hypothetical protein [Accumulibacter sp.]